jgi:putative hemolysin
MIGNSLQPSCSKMKAMNMTTAASYRWCAALGCLLILSNAGCSSLTTTKSKNGKKDSNWSFFQKKEYQTPQSINGTWTYDIFTKEGKPPTRGFGGRLYFYNEKSQAIPVEGELTVYGFDDTHRSHDGSSIESADKKFRFTAEQFTSHFSESELGASYSIWIPWDAAPGMQKKIMLIPTFKSKDGPVIRGNAATVLLPGIANAEGDQQVIQASMHGGAQRASGVQRASHTSSAKPASAMRPVDSHLSNRTTTIQLPSRGYQAKPMLSAEQAAALLQQVQDSQSPTQLPVLPSVDPQLGSPQSGNLESATTVGNTQVPATQVATPTPSFHLPIGTPLGAIGQPSPVNVSGLPGFANVSVGQRPTHSAPSSLPAPAGPAAPSSAYLTR